MKKILLSTLMLITSLPIFSQLNVQLHYDFADAFYRIVDCRGREVARGVLQKLTALVVPCAGMVLIEP